MPFLLVVRFRVLELQSKVLFFFTSFSSILIYYSEYATTDLCASQLLYFFTLRATKSNAKTVIQLQYSYQV